MLLFDFRWLVHETLWEELLALWKPTSVLPTTYNLCLFCSSPVNGHTCYLSTCHWQDFFWPTDCYLAGNEIFCLYCTHSLIGVQNWIVRTSVIHCKFSHLVHLWHILILLLYRFPKAFPCFWICNQDSTYISLSHAYILKSKYINQCHVKLNSK